MRPILTQQNSTITDGDLNEAEQEMHIKFPEAYRQFLKMNNGGRPSPSYYKISNPEANENLTSVHFFNGIKAQLSDVAKDYISLSDRIPGDLIPIARDPGGNIICMGWKGDRLNKIFIWWHDIPVDEEDEPCYDAIDLIADSFEEFINGFSEYDKV